MMEEDIKLAEKLCNSYWHAADDIMVVNGLSSRE